MENGGIFQVHFLAALTPHASLINFDLKDVVQTSGDEECTSKVRAEHIADSAVSALVRPVVPHNSCPW